MQLDGAVQVDGDIPFGRRVKAIRGWIGMGPSRRGLGWALGDVAGPACGSWAMGDTRPKRRRLADLVLGRDARGGPRAALALVR